MRPEDGRRDEGVEDGIRDGECACVCVCVCEGETVKGRGQSHERGVE